MKSNRNWVMKEKHYGFSEKYFEQYMKRLNSKNHTVRDDAILGGNQSNSRPKTLQEYQKMLQSKHPRVFNQTYVDELLGIPKTDSDRRNSVFDNTPQEIRRTLARENPKWIFLMNEPTGAKPAQQSENFHIVQNVNTTFQNIGGYDSIKEELSQCVDIL